MALKASVNKLKSPSKKKENETADQRPGTSQDTQETKKISKFCKKRSPKQKPSPQHLSLPSTSGVVFSQSRQVFSHSRQVFSQTRPVFSQSRQRVSRNLFMPIIPTTVIPVTTMATLYSQYQGQNLRYSFQNWNMARTVPVQNPVYNMPYQPVPLVVPPVMPSICPYTGAFYTQPMLRPIVPPPPPVVYEEYSASSFTYNSTSMFSPEQTVPTPVVDEFEQVNAPEPTLYETVQYRRNVDPLETYLSLPRDLFPAARMLAMDPNPIIDKFCKIDNIHSHAPWILDLEFGIPRVPVTRQIAIYDVKFNSVHCKNTPSAIHPGFESCSEEFKKDFRFYYDCVTSKWYRGYMFLNNDRSVENFQSWLLMPMQMFGMCWP